MNNPPPIEEVLVRESRTIGVERESAAVERLGRRISKAIAAGGFATTKIRIAVLSSFLTDMLCDALSAFLLSRGVAAAIVRGPFGVIATDLLSDNSITRDCDLVLILPTYRDLAFVPDLGCLPEEANDAVEREAAFWAGLWTRNDKPIVQLTFDPPPSRALSEADAFQPGGLLRHQRRVNQRLGDLAPARVALVDAEALAGRLGAKWHDARTYHLCKQPFAAAATPDIADALAASAAGLLGKARKVLVLDLDNTLWGGVVGDVGVQGLALGMETPEGEAFVALQAYAQALARRGVILAVCSKNAEEVARTPFREHSGMVLKEQDFACFVANFEDKASNLKRIAQALNVGLDALVFVDDNPVERAWVKQELPEVLVIDLPDDVALFSEAIERARAFPLHRLTAEDLGRNASYRARAEIVEAQGNATDMAAFLRGLEPIATVEAVSNGSLDRILQLVAKTNQFKLNPRLFSAEDLRQKERGVFAISLKDRLQNYGIVAVAVVEIRANDAIILNWVMSCRVFSRRLEHMTLECIREFAAAREARNVVASFVQSPKNRVAYECLIELGFVGTCNGNLAISVAPESPPVPHYMSVIRAAE